MKKTYINPRTLVLPASCPQLFATSIPVSTDEVADKDYPGGGDVKEHTSLWDNEW